MDCIAKFEKISKEQFSKDWDSSCLGIMGPASDFYGEIKLPKRATKGSAGYDFFAPFDIFLDPGETIKFPTGIRCKIEDGWFLMIVPRSSLGFKYRLQLDNTVGIIDSDYYGSSNEGHMFIKITNDSNTGRSLVVNKGEAVAQGIFIPFGIVEDDDASAIRDGGFGSTNK